MSRKIKINEMKNKLFLFILLSMLCLNLGFSQTKDSTDKTNAAVDSTKRTYVFCEAMVRYNIYGKYMKTECDFGTYYNVVDAKREESENKVRSFKNGVDIMNFLSEDGWEYLQTTSNFVGNTQFVVYTFRKVKN